MINLFFGSQTKYKDMTFIWTEISFLATWYAKAHDTRKVNFQTLVEEGRLEIPTGGWIMTDEANVEVFGMVNQLIEGECLSYKEEDLSLKAMSFRASMASYQTECDPKVILVL